ncbi:MAG TPA: glycosyltransferase [Solirubrobacteraceae bacterium]|nr:glycosyltransferase [Solirubrobacteraceae bacterium]
MASARRLKVLSLIDSVVLSGGAERFTVALATHLPRDRFELWMCSSRHAEPDALALLEEAGVPHVHLGRTGKLDVHRLAGLAALLRRERFDILHTQKFGSNLWGSLIGAACRTPVIIAHEHTWSYEGAPLRRWLDGQVIARLATRFIAVSAQDARRMVSIEHIAPEKVLTIPTAYIPRPRVGTDLRAELGIERSTRLLAAVAVLRPQKALSVLLDALPGVLASVPDAHLVIAGDGECRDELVAHAARSGLGERVHFLGRRGDVEEILEAADIAVISSDYEGTPLVAFECFATGTPLVATAVGGLVEIIDDGVTGRLVPPRDPQALAAAIVELALDPELRGRIAAAAQRSVIRMDTVAARVGALYETLAAERGLIGAPRHVSPPGSVAA